MDTSETSISGTGKLVAKAQELGAAVLREKTPQAARAYIGWVAELEPTVYMPAQGELETALNLAVDDMLKADFRLGQQIYNYEFWCGIAKMYGLKGNVKAYSAEITRLMHHIR